MCYFKETLKVDLPLNYSPVKEIVLCHLNKCVIVMLGNGGFTHYPWEYMLIVQEEYGGSSKI